MIDSQGRSIARRSNDAAAKFEAGTSNIADAIAFGVAVEYLEQVGRSGARSRAALDRLRARSAGSVEPRGLAIYGLGTRADLGRHLFNLADVHAHDLRFHLGHRRRLRARRPPCTMPLMEKRAVRDDSRVVPIYYNPRRLGTCSCAGL